MTDITELVQRARINAECGEFLSPAETIELVEALEKSENTSEARREAIDITHKRAVRERDRANAAEEALEKVQRANSAQDDHINQQQDRIDQLEKRNADLGKHVGMLEKRLKGTEESLIASTDMVTELESRTVKLPRPGFVTISGERTDVYLKADVDAAMLAAGIEETE